MFEHACVEDPRPNIFFHIVILECVQPHNTMSEYDTMFDVVVKFDSFEVCYFGLCIPFNMYLKNGILKTCFRQSPKEEMTALDVR